ncbi:MAG: flagellar basal-body MS-ring/collar protein FliF [Gemmatales bacterium]|nr:flagellar basal-body MS-ring/collar protein FliF [Gemmatales bacterium]MDW7995827.1 flagellar basal-body MS-ring/collar protein FliF [Gemmatales bacterium]
MNWWLQLREQISRLWQGLSWPRRAFFLGAVLALISALLGLIYWALQPEYRVLYSGLALEDSGAITARLQAQNIPYRLENQGTTILVPVQYHQQALVDLARAGLPARGGKTFDDLFDQGTPFGLTPFLQQVNFTRALQTELARTIMQLEPVAYARVHITRPEPSPFVRERKPVTASVMLRLKPGMTLPRSTASAIVALVSRSVEGLAPENVTIVDSQGRLLTEPATEGGLSGHLLDRKRDYEAYLAAEAEKMLTAVLGPGKAIVRVAVEFNHQTLTEKSESYNLEQKPIRRSEIVNEKTTGTMGLARGPAGTTSNLQRTMPAGANTSSEQRETETTEYYPPARTEITRVHSAGQIERLTVAVMVDLSGPRTGKPLTVSEVQELVKQAVGFKPGRDEIRVTEVQLQLPAPSTLEQEYLSAQAWERYLALAKSISLALVALAGLAFGWLVLRSWKPSAGTATPAAPGVVELAKQQPEMLARIIAQWLEQEGNLVQREAPASAATPAQAARPPLRAAA